ncbi:MAG TPA: FAD/NAD(P)-binding protein, partial [Micromonosporaceae bacterium]|nr:FAD/NAD(P)-binding protein [Micromonosporaceae bacterium]
PLGEAIADPLPGQFSMVYAFGVGEVPISVSGRSGTGDILHTVRTVGAVTRALHAARPGGVLGLRGPFGSGWRIPAPAGSDVVIVAGGIGLAPLRPVVRHALAQRARYRGVTLLIGARTPADLLFTDEYAGWRAGGVDVRVTVDRAGADWTGHVGVVTTLFDHVVTDPGRTVGYTCGPEVMMRFAARGLVDRGVPGSAIDVSLERNMRCGIALCGHCQLGPLVVCRDGPVVGYDRAAPLLAVKEL